MAFSFGSSTSGDKKAGSSFSFGGASTAATPAASTSGFSFGGGAAAPAATTTTTAPATGGFSFGGATPAATPAAAPSTSGFSFGGTPAKPAATTAAPATGGFSFGGATAAATPAATTPATTATPATGGFSFGGAASTAATTAATPAATTTTTTAPATGGFSFGGASTTAATTTPATTTTAPATGGFSFGGAAATKPAETKAASGFSFGGASKDSTAASAAPSTTAAPATGGFSFGGTTAAPTTATAAATTPAAAGGFSFGGASTASATPATTSLTTTTTAPASTSAAGGGFSFGGASAATTTTTPAATTTGALAAVPTSTATPTTAQEKPPAIYMDKTVEDIINMWSEELESHANTFTNEAVKVCNWDIELIENQKKISELAKDVYRLQSELDSSLNAISAYQQELRTSMEQLENDIDKMYETQSRVPEAADIEREATFQLAIDIDAQLIGMNKTLKETVEKLNSSYDSQTRDSDNPMNQILKVLNVHHTSLQWIESNTSRLNHEIDAVSQQLDQHDLDVSDHIISSILQYNDDEICVEEMKNDSNGSVTTILMDKRAVSNVLQKFPRPTTAFVHSSGRVFNFRIQRYVKLPENERPQSIPKFRKIPATTTTTAVKPRIPLTSSKAGRAALKRFENQKESTETTAPTSTKKPKRRPLSKSYMNKLLEAVGDRILDLRETFDRHANEELLTLENVVTAMEDLRAQNYYEKPVTSHSAKIMENATAALAQLIELDMLSIDGIPASRHTPFLSFGDFVSFFAQTRVLLKTSIEDIPSSEEEVIVDFPDYQGDITDTAVIKEPNWEGMGYYKPATLLLHEGDDNIESVIVQDKERDESTSNSKDLQLKSVFGQYDLYGHEDCHEVALSDLPDIFSEAFGQVISLERVRQILFDEAKDREVSSTSNMWKTGTATFDDALLILRSVEKDIIANSNDNGDSTTTAAPVENPTSTDKGERNAVEAPTATVIIDSQKIISDILTEAVLKTAAAQMLKKEDEGFHKVPDISADANEIQAAEPTASSSRISVS